MLSRALIDLIVALLHEVIDSRHRRRDRRGGRRHRCTAVAPASPSPPLVVPHHRVLERHPSPSPDQLAYQPMVLSDPDAHPRDHQGGPCAIHGWDCPNRVAPVHDPLSSSRQGEEEGGEEEKDKRCISVVTGPVEAPAIRRMARISIGPRG
jgi:hypothetical protein